jgi:Ca2+-binding RTX toxin-like protein
MIHMRKALSGALALALIVTSSVAVAPSSSLAEPSTPIPPDLTSGIQTMTTSLAMISTLEEITGPIPGLDESVATLLDLHQFFIGIGVAASGTQADFQAAIDALESGDALGGWDVAGVEVSTDGAITRIGFDAALPSVTKQANLTVVNDDLQLLGTALDVTVSAPLVHFEFEFDDASNELALTEFSDLTFDLDVSSTITGETVVLGFAEATLAGTVNVNTGVSLGFVDPDGDGRITESELSGLAIPDAFTLDPVVDGTDDLDLDLDLSADVFGQVFTGTLTIDDESIFNDPAPVTTLSGTGTNPIDLFTNFSAESAITSISQLVSTFGGAMIGGDVNIPLLGDGVFLPADLGADPGGFDKAFEAIQPLLDYIKPRAEGQIVCGVRSTPPDASTDGVPYGSVLNLTSGDTAECRVYAAAPVQSGTVEWQVTSGNATLGAETTGAAADGTASDAPTKNAHFTMAADGELEVSVTYTLVGESDEITIVQRPDTIQELLLELLAAGLVEPTIADTAVPNVTFNSELQAIEFDLGISTDPVERSITVNAGDELIAETGLGGLSGSATGGLNLGAVSASTTVGVILAEDPADINPGDNNDFDPGPGDRLFLRNTDALLTVGDLELDANAALVGRLGFLEITADLEANVSKPDANQPALQVGFAPLGVTVEGNTDAGATLVTSLLRAGPSSFNADVNLALAGELDVDANVPGISGGGTIGIDWDFNAPRPTLDVSTEFENNLFPFDTSQTLTYSGPAPTDETVFTVAAPGGLLAQAGLVGSKLVDGNGNTCTITSVTSDTELRCENTATPGDLNPITFASGTTYEVTGNTLAHLAQILAAIDGLAGSLEGMIGDAAFNEPIPVLGITPADLVGQIQRLRAMVDEFRGIQDGQIVCAVTAPPFTGSESTDRAIKTTSGNATLGCRAAASTSNPTAIRWRINDVTNGDATPTAWIDGPNTVGSAPSSNVSLNLVALDDNGDGYINLGSEYTVEVEWTEGGELQTSALPPRTPQSLQQLARSITDILGLPDNALGLELVGIGSDPTLRINLAYAFCSSVAPTGLEDRCDGMPTALAPSVNLNFDLGGALPDFVGFETTGELVVKYAAAGQFDIGVPLSGASPLLYGTTGLDVAVQVEGTDLSLTASIGPIEATLGAAAVITGEANNDDNADGGTDADDLLLIDDDADLSGVVDGTPVTRTSDGLTCSATGTGAADRFTCDLGLDGDSNQIAWSLGDAYRIGGLGQLNAGLQFSAGIANGGTPLGPNDSIPIFVGNSFNPALGIDTTDLADLGSASCEPFDSSRFTETIVFGADDGDEALSGLACGLLSMQLDVGTASIYVGELALDWDGPALAVYTPTDLADRLLEAVLNPAFLLRALPPVLGSIEDGLRDAAADVPAAVGDPLAIGADGVGAIKDAAQLAVDTFADALEGIASVDDLATTVDDELTALLQPNDDGLPVELTVDVVVATDCNGDCAGLSITELQDISVQLIFTASVEATTGVNLGLEALPISFDAGVRGYAEFTATAGLGVSRADGPYLLLNSDEPDPDNPDDDPTTGPEVTLTAGVDLAAGASGCAAPMQALAADYTTDRCMRGRLAFLFIEALDATGNGPAPSGISATVSLDITSSAPKVTLSNIGTIGVTGDVEGGVDLNLHIRTGIETEFTTTADLPSVLGTLSLSWGASAQGGVEPLLMSFDNLNLDIGSFLSEFMGPVVKEVKKITGPLQPIVEILTAPIPVVSDLAELVGSNPITMISLLEAAAGADLSLVKALAAFISFVNALPEDGNILLPLGALTGGAPVNNMPARQGGAFSVNTAAAATALSPEQAGALIGASPAGKAGKGFASDISSRTGLPSGTTAQNRPATFGVPGLSFPFLEDSSQIFGLLVGRDAVLIRWDAGTLEAKAGFSYDFGPIMVGPVPITITIGGEVGVRGRFAIGYDTSGIRQLLAGGSGLALFDGIFIDDLDANGKDVPEIQFFGRVFAGASVDLVIVSAGVRGGIELTFSLDLDDRPDPDGKLRILEIVDKLANPICLFTVSGKIEAFLEAFVKIDLFFYSKEFSFELVRITLLEWSAACEPPSPVLSEPAEPTDGVLYLNVGSRRDRRNIQEEEIHESIEVRQIGPNKVRVSGMGWEETREDVNLIVVDGGSGADELKFLSGVLEGTDNTPQEWTIPVVASGGPGNDIIAVQGASADHLMGDDNVSGGTWAGVDYSAIPFELPHGDDGDNADQINAGGGDDLVEAGPGNDTADGQFGRDTVLGGDGDDNLSGGPGDDVVDGQAGDDTVQGGPIDQPAANSDADDDDVLAGGVGSDVASGDFGDDWIFGDNLGSGSVIDLGDPADGRLQRANAADTVAWCAATTDDDGADILTGTDGDDVLVGGGGADQMDAGNGADFACGGNGDDTILGGSGDDTLQGDDEQDTIDGNAGDDHINGGNGNDLIHGDAGNDDIFGDGDADLLFGDDGDDIVVGDTGTLDTAHEHGVGASPAADAMIDLARVTALDADLAETSTTGGPRRVDCLGVASGIGASDCLFGGNGSDAVFGGSDGDVMFGESGADLLVGNHGDDDIRGGIGNDLLLGSEDNDVINGDSGNDGAYGDRSIAEWAIDSPAAGGTDTIAGGPGSDHLEGDGGNDDIDGGGGNDQVEGNNGDDALRGGVGDDDIIGGSDTESTYGDGGDIGDSAVFGGPGQDVIAGDNAVITPGGYVLGRSVTLLEIEAVGVGGGDVIAGEAGTDAIFGQAGDDTLYGGFSGGTPGGNADANYVEGNDGDDTIVGDAGSDDLVGGGSANLGPIVAGRDGTGLADGNDDIGGGAGRDWIAGDNARFDRVLGTGIDYPDAAVEPIQLFDLLAVDSPITQDSFGEDPFGNDTIRGGSATDLMFGQGGDDHLEGNESPDYVEGNDGDDGIDGGDGNDDLVGGGSAADGLIVSDRNGAGLFDGGETSIVGGLGNDAIAGDNARMNRVLFATADYPSPDVDPIVLFDLAGNGLPGVPAVVSNPSLFGDDVADGDAGTDLMFGQGGADTFRGGTGNDYIEGNDGDDTLHGQDGADDVIGGGSATDGVIDIERVGDGLHDVGESLVDGGADNDWIMGDNAFSNRVLFDDGQVPIRLFDVNSTAVNTSGGDRIDGSTGDDLIFGQGNGDQDPSQGDPLDGFDNDLDGREGATSTEYDCADGFDNDGDGGTDDRLGCTSKIDEDSLWTGDTINGGDGEDYIEGNHGADWMFGNAGQDDLIGGGSAIDGVIDDDRSGVGLADGPDVIAGGGDHDVILGDNGVVKKLRVGDDWQQITNATADFDLIDRTVTMATAPENAGNFGNDHLRGGDAHDQLYGQQGHDLIEGDAGDDALVGDLGAIISSVSTGPEQLIKPNQPFIQDHIFATDTLNHLTTLFAQQTGDGAEGNDIILGGQGHDDLHGGPGHDLMNGDLFGDTAPPSPDLITMTPGQYTADNLTTGVVPFENEDALFGGFGDDVMWGGRDPDHLYGGHGNDKIDVRPRPGGASYPRDPAAWFTWTRVQLADDTFTEEHYQDSDTINGGFGHDEMQANLSKPGPNDGDQMFDSVGAYNLYYICPPHYGSYTAVRALSPGLPEFFSNLAAGDGLLDPATPGSSGFSELGFVYNSDANANANPPHPETPGHFYCGAGTSGGGGNGGGKNK